MLIAHLPSGYLLGAFAQRRVPLQASAIMAAALIGSVAPDLDLLYFHLIDGRQTNHRDFFTHWPLFWLAFGFALAIVALVFQRKLLPLVLVFYAGVMLHMATDTVAAPIHWLAPFSQSATELVRIPKIHPNWIVSFVFHWTFLNEIAICLAALALFLSRSFAVFGRADTSDSAQIAFPRKRCLKKSASCGKSQPRLQGYSSVGRAAVSKTAGRGFEPCCPCQFSSQCSKVLIAARVARLSRAAFCCSLFP